MKSIEQYTVEEVLELLLNVHVDSAEEILDLFQGFANPFPIYRTIALEKWADMDYDDLGNHWSFDRQSAINFASYNAGGNIMISGMIYKKDVGWDETLIAYEQFSGQFSDEDENEIYVPDPTKVFDVEIEQYTGSKINEIIIEEIINVEKLNERNYSLDEKDQHLLKFLHDNNIKFDDLNWLGSGDYGTAYSTNDGRVLKITSSNSEYDIANKIIDAGDIPALDGFVKYYDTDVFSNKYFILMEELDEDSNIENLYYELDNYLSEEGLPIQYVHMLDIDELNLGQELIDFISDIEDINSSNRYLGIEASDLKPDNLGRDKNGKVKMFDIFDKNDVYENIIDDKIKNLNEDPDSIYKEFNYKTLDLEWSDYDALVFGYLENKLLTDHNIPHVSMIRDAISSGEYTNSSIQERFYEIQNNENFSDTQKEARIDDFIREYSDEIRSELKYDGRLWTNSKVISFWKFPENTIVLFRILRDIENKTGLNIIKNDYVIEVRDKENYQTLLIPIKQYDGKFFVNIPNKPHDMPQDKWLKMGGKKTIPHNTIYHNKRKEKGVVSKTPAEYNFITQKNVAENIYDNILNEVYDLLEYNAEDSFLSSYDTAKKYAYENIDDVAEAFDAYNEDPDDVQAEYAYNNYIELIDLYVDKYNYLKNQNVVEIYRLVKLNSLKDLDLKNIGMHWSFEKSGVGDYGGIHPKANYNNPNTKPYVLTAYVNPKDIDWIYGFNSFIWYGEDQWECALNKNTEVVITHINDKELSKNLIAYVGDH